MTKLIKNALIIPMTKENHYTFGDILIKNGKISSIGNSLKINEKIDEIIDASNMIALPSFVNAHTHSSMVLMRNYKDTCSNLMDWLSEIFPIEDKLNAHDILVASRLAIAEMLKSGTTCFSDMYFIQGETIKAAKELGIRAVIGLTLFGDEKETDKRLNNLYPALLKEIDGDDRYNVAIAPHAIYTCTKGTYIKARDFALDNRLIIHTHLSETKGEVENSLKDFKLRPASYLDSLGLFDAKTIVAHSVYLSEEEVQILSSKGVSVIHNPSSNCKLASGIAPVSHYRRSGINVALGTDGASSNNNLNMLKEMNIASLISTVSTLDPISLPPYEVLKMATINGARALGLDSKIGSLEIGKDADLILMDMNMINTSPMNDPFSAIVFSADRGNINTVLVKGETVVKNGKLVNTDENELIKETNKAWEDIKNRK